MIRAEPDHKERVRPSLTTDTHPPHYLGRVLQLMGRAEEPQQHRAAALAGIAFTNHTIARVLDDADAFHDAYDGEGIQTDPKWLLLPEYVQCLCTASYFLNPYAELLVREQAA